MHRPVSESPAAPAVGWASGPLGAVQAADREIARQTALRARAVAEFAATRPASADRQPEQRGAMSAERRAARPDVLADVSEWAAQELVVALSITSSGAEALLTRSLTLVHRLPRTLAALEAGALHPGHLWPMLEKVAPIPDATVRDQVESALLAWAAGRVATPAQLGAKARRMVLARDARNAAARLTAALRKRGVSVRPDEDDGMATLTAVLTRPEARALFDALGRYADALDDEPSGELPEPSQPRTRGQKMADCLLDLVLRPGATDLPPVQAQLTLVAGVTTLAGGDEPGELDGEPVPAEMVRALARSLGLLPDDSAGQVAPQTGRLGSVEPIPPVGLSMAEVGATAKAEQRALEAWWAEAEQRVLRDPWGGAEAPPAEVLERMWAQESRWHGDPAGGACLPMTWPDDVAELALLDGPSEVVAPQPALPAVALPDGGPQHVGAGWWSVADRAVDAAGAAVLDAQRAVGLARRAVADAERTDAADEAAWRDGPDGRMSGVTDTIAALASATTDQRAALARLLDATGGGGRVDRPRIAVVDALSGALLALTDSRELRRRSACFRRACRRDPGRCTHDLRGVPGLGPPGPSPGYRPRAALDRWVRARDRRCRFPGCRARVPRTGELDHDRAWPDGPTSATNLAGYCTPHHRGKHQAPGWRHELAADGTLTVATPTGLRASTEPPPY